MGDMLSPAHAWDQRRLVALISSSVLSPRSAGHRHPGSVYFGKFLYTVNGKFDLLLDCILKVYGLC